VPKKILDPENLNDKISFEMINNSYTNLDPANYPDMKKFADFLNSQEVSRSPKYLINSKAGLPVSKLFLSEMIIGGIKMKKHILKKLFLKLLLTKTPQSFRLRIMKLI